MENEGTRQEKRDRKLSRRRRKMLQHGRSLVRVYKDAALKRRNRRRKR
ncbi:MAG: hypothetical protein IBX68_00390 [Dehalococcoidia bacterium]|nr:hypothetical protein [Dehalococcoidia bacterium]